MLPIQLAGLALAGRTLLTKTSFLKLGIQREQDIPMPIVNPLETITKTLASSISQIKKTAFGETRNSEDYYSIVKKHMPEGAKLLIPVRPSYAREIHLVDIDGDFSDELISSFKLNNEIRTIVLKKQDDNWYKAVEILNDEYDALNYRGVVDFIGTGKRQLIIGLSSKAKPSKVYGYSFEGGKTSEMFSRDYDRLDVLRESYTKDIQSKAELAIWHREKDGTYDIEMLRWNGLNLEPSEISNNYYKEKVIPYFVQRVKKESNVVSNWYNLADILLKSGANRDALAIIDVGNNLSKNPDVKRKFSDLRSRV